MNKPENNSTFDVEVDCSNGIYQFSFTDTDTETETKTMETDLIVNTITNKVLYSIHMPEYQVIKNFNFIDFTMGLAQ